MVNRCEVTNCKNDAELMLGIDGGDTGNLYPNVCRSCYNKHPTLRKFSLEGYPKELVVQ